MRSPHLRKPDRTVRTSSRMQMNAYHRCVSCNGVCAVACCVSVVNGLGGTRWFCHYYALLCSVCVPTNTLTSHTHHYRPYTPQLLTSLSQSLKLDSADAVSAPAPAAAAGAATAGEGEVQLLTPKSAVEDLFGVQMLETYMITYRLFLQPQCPCLCIATILFLIILSYSILCSLHAS